MALLALFAFIAGAGTALSPCVLPVLPAVLSASAAGGRRRPLGVVLGLALTFTITIAGLGAVVDGVGLGDSALRTVAAVVLLGFGLVLLLPRLGARIEAPLSRLARFGPRDRGDGFLSGVAVGAALGFAYAPCAGPILAAVITVGAAAGTTVPIALAYALGSATVLLALSLGGRRVAGRIRRAGRGPAVQRALGVVMVLTAVAVAADLDVRFQTALAEPADCVLRDRAASCDNALYSVRYPVTRTLDAMYRRITAQLGRRVAYVALDDVLCPRAGRCPAIIGGVLARYDGVHYTATFSRRIVPVIVERAQRAGIAFARR